MIRGNWVFGPIIHSTNKESHNEILRLMIEAVDSVLTKYDLVHIEGYSSPNDPFVDDDYLKKIKKNGYTVKPFVTFIASVQKSIDDLWKNVHPSARRDVKKSEKRKTSKTGTTS